MARPAAVPLTVDNIRQDQITVAAHVAAQKAADALRYHLEERCCPGEAFTADVIEVSVGKNPPRLRVIIESALIKPIG